MVKGNRLTVKVPIKGVLSKHNLVPRARKALVTRLKQASKHICLCKIHTRTFFKTKVHFFINAKYTVSYSDRVYGE